MLDLITDGSASNRTIERLVISPNGTIAGQGTTIPSLIQHVYLITR